MNPTTKKLFSFGELLMRLAPEGYLRFGQNDRLEMTFGGAEANVAIACAQLGMETEYITKLPDNPIGQAALNTVRAFGVGTSGIVRGGERIGIYFCEKGASLRPTKVIYDRKHSAISEADREDFDWNTAFAKAVPGDFFHFTGITPALSPECVNISLDAAKAAQERGMTVTCDLNYRSTLWSKEEARIAMEKLVPYVDAIITNIEQVDDVFGIHPAKEISNGDEADLDAYREVSVEMNRRFGCRYYAYTTRKSISASDNIIGALIYDAEKDVFALAPNYNVRIVDRVGGGDAFAAAMIYGMANSFGLQKTVEYAEAAAALKHTVEGDFARFTPAEIEAAANGNTSGRVQR